jgi:hypothetical protein
VDRRLTLHVNNAFLCGLSSFPSGPNDCFCPISASPLQRRPCAVRSTQHFARGISYSLLALGTLYLARVTGPRSGIFVRRAQHFVGSLKSSRRERVLRAGRGEASSCVRSTECSARGTKYDAGSQPHCIRSCISRSGRSSTSVIGQKRTNHLYRRGRLNTWLGGACDYFH